MTLTVHVFFVFFFFPHIKAMCDSSAKFSSCFPIALTEVYYKGMMCSCPREPFQVFLL